MIGDDIEVTVVGIRGDKVHLGISDLTDSAAHRAGESIMIGDDIKITVVDIRGDKVRLGIIAPMSGAVHRKEIWEAIRRKNPPIPGMTVEDLVAPDRPTVDIRLATAADLAAINDIYNHYVHHSTCTYQEEPEPIESRRRWFASHGEKHPITVATIDDRVIGWGSLSRFHARSAYGSTVENSVYVDHQMHRSGIGTVILSDLIDRARTIGHHTIIAGIDAEQPASLAIHARFGFEKVGHLKQVGFKFGRWLDVIYLQRIL